MAMKISTRQAQEATILDVNGRITLNEGCVALGDMVRELAEKGTKRIVLNLAQVSYVDSSGMGEFVTAYSTLRNHGGTLVLLNVPKKVRDLLQMTGLDTVFEIRDDEAAATGA